METSEQELRPFQNCDFARKTRNVLNIAIKLLLDKEFPQMQEDVVES